MVIILIIFVFPLISAKYHHDTTAETYSSRANVVALLIWKASLESESQLLLSSWKNTSKTPCYWDFIHCDKIGRVTEMNMPNNSINGTLHHLDFSSFSNLLRIDFSNNSLYGTLPTNIFNLSKLSCLDLGYNDFSGVVPPEIGFLKNLKYLLLDHTRFSGFLPQELGMLESLLVFRVQASNLTGTIPASLGNLSSLSFLYLDYNKFSGHIPQEIGILSSLKGLFLSRNTFIGCIPTSFGNLTNLESLYLHTNSLSGPIPQEMWSMTHLTDIDLGLNSLTGQIPSSIGNFSKLFSLILSINKFTGEIPISIGDLGNLFYLSLCGNRLSGPIPSSIGNLTKLETLYLCQNGFHGPIPPSFGNLKSLADMRLFSNKLNGSLPVELENITNWEMFHLANNNLTGHLPHNVCLGGFLTEISVQNNRLIGGIPRSLRNCSKLSRVRLDNNKLSGNLSEAFSVYPNLDYIDLSHNDLKMSNNNLFGSIPFEIGNASNLQVLDLSSNHFSGKVPRSLDSLKLLFDLDLSGNRLSGGIPSQLGRPSTLAKLNLAANHLSGIIPQDIGNLLQLLSLNLSRNMLYSSIPSNIGSLHFLQNMDLSHNMLNGEIPWQLGRLQSLEAMNLSQNKLIGFIPSSFNQCISLIFVDISNNQLIGPLPNNLAFQNMSLEELRGNKGLCGHLIGLKPCSSSKIINKRIKISAILFSLSGVLLLMVILCLFFAVSWKRRNQIEQRKQTKDFFSIWSFDGKMTYESIIIATEAFNSKYCIGNGGEGRVFRVELPSGQVVAVKKFHSSHDGELDSLKGFKNETKTLLKIRHCNIVKLYGFCSHARHSFLVYEFLEGGSLSERLRNDEKATELDWIKRVNIVKGVACALSYMHHECSPPILHRDISSKNVLLDHDNRPHLSDFGTAKLLRTNSFNWTTFAGTFGYAAPELAYNMEVNESCDTYSFGVLLLEVILGRHPADLVEAISSLSSTSEILGILLKDLIDQRPLPPSRVAEELILITKIALTCLHPSPQLRPTMQQVSASLAKDKTQLNNSSFLFL
ncbi:unnamed protein product [Withania somnifera]